MKVLVVLAHPSVKSFNHAIAETTVQTLKDNGHDVAFHDLYRENFDPVLRSEEIPRDAMLDPLIKTHTNDLAGADGIVVIHPSWWGQPPAILKGWIDRTFRAGVAYEFKDSEAGAGTPVGLLKADTALVINTTNTPQEIIVKVFGDTLEDIWDKSVLGFCGVKNFNRKVYDQVIISSPEQIKARLDDVRAAVDQLFAKPGELKMPA